MDRNLILAISLSLLVFLGFDYFILGPQRAIYQEQLEQYERENPTAAAPNLDDLTSSAMTNVANAVTIEEAIAAAPGRVKIESPEFSGTINLKGARIDDLSLKNYAKTLEEDSGMLRLFKPRETQYGHYIQSGIIAGTQTSDDIVWTVSEGDILTPSSPVTLSYSENGLTHSMALAVDEKFMFTVTQTVTNTSSETIKVTPFASAVQRGLRDDLRNFFILLEGPIAEVSGQLYDRKYKDILKKGGFDVSGTGGWTGLTDKLFLAAVIPPQDETFKTVIKNRGTELEPIYYSSFSLATRDLAPGASTTLTNHMYGGVKEVAALRTYEKPVSEGGLGISKFDNAIDWGIMWFFTKPIYTMLHFFAELTGNYGIAILLLTLVIKAVLFPLANKAYKSTAGMKLVQPELTKLREKYPDDKMKLQQEMMALYKKHNINPVAGCVPLLIQMPIFFALYKTLFVTSEMRHQGFLYIQDLSERDPTNMFNLFGLLPFDPTNMPVIGDFLGIGILALLMGIGMWVQMKLNPPATDPIQQQVMTLMPILFTFMFAPFAAGLLLYWVWNTVLSIAQQWVIMSRAGVKVDLLGNIKASFKRKTNAEAAGNDN